MASGSLIVIELPETMRAKDVFEKYYKGHPQINVSDLTSMRVGRDAFHYLDHGEGGLFQVTTQIMGWKPVYRPDGRLTDKQKLVFANTFQRLDPPTIEIDAGTKFVVRV